MAAYLVKVLLASKDEDFVFVEADSALDAVAKVGGDNRFEVWSLRTLEPRQYRLVTETSIQRIL